MTTGGRFFLQDPMLHAREIPHMMCRVVRKKCSAIDEYGPVNVQTNEVIPDILPLPSKYNNVVQTTGRTKNPSARASLSSLFSISGENITDNEATLKADAVKMYMLSNPGRVFDQLMENDDYARDVRKMRARRKPAYLVVGFMTASGGAQWSQKRHEAKKRNGDFSVPTGTALGLPPIDILPGLNLDVGVGGGSNNSKRGSLEAIADDEEIFAVTYMAIKSKYGVNWNGYTKREVLGSRIRADAKHQAFSQDNEEDEAEDEDENEDDEEADGEDGDIEDDDEEFSLEAVSVSQEDFQNSFVS